MTHEELCDYIQQSRFIDKEEWARILQNEEHDILIDYEQIEEPWTLVSQLP